MRFNEKLQKLRKEKGMSQEDLAEVLNVSRQAISKWESGLSYPEMDKLIALSSMFNTTLDELVKDGEVNPNQSNTESANPWTRRRRHYEYKSTKTFLGLPLVHVNIGLGIRKAKGIIAIGNVASGIISIGLASIGVLSLGLASLGVLSLAVFSVGLLLALGSVAIGTVAIGAIAVGIFTIGAISFGVFSLGAISIASHIAIGDHANGHIAIGRIANGVKTLTVSDSNRIFIDVTREQVRTLINEQFPTMWRWIVDLITGMFR